MFSLMLAVNEDAGLGRTTDLSVFDLVHAPVPLPRGPGGGRNTCQLQVRLSLFAVIG